MYKIETILVDSNNSPTKMGLHHATKLGVGKNHSDDGFIGWGSHDIGGLAMEKKPESIKTNIDTYFPTFEIPSGT